MISFDEAFVEVARLATPLRQETVDLGNASGRVLAAPVIASFDAPRSATSAMDGYAIRDAELRNGQRRFRVAGKSFAGAPFAGVTREGDAVRIFTGASVPAGLDRVVIQEDVETQGDVVFVVKDQEDRYHVRECGADFLAGDEIVPAGQLITPAALIAIAGADQAEVAVHVKPKVAILATGDELVAPGTARTSDHAIPDSLTVGISALIEQFGGCIGTRKRLADDLSGLRHAAGDMASAHDIVVVTGGASVGERDFGKAMFEALNPDYIFKKVAMKPGKPVWAARTKGCILIGLPGNPGSALVTARLFLAPLVAGLSGRAPASAMQWEKHKLAEDLPANGSRETFMRGRLTPTGVEPVSNQDSSAQAVLAQSNVLIRRQPNDPAQRAGSHVRVLSI